VTCLIGAATIAATKGTIFWFWGCLALAGVLLVAALALLLPLGRWIRYPRYRKSRAELAELMKRSHAWATVTHQPHPLEAPIVKFMTGRGTHKEPTSARPASVEFVRPKGGIARERELPIRVACGFGYVTITDFEDDGFVVSEDRTAKDSVEVRVRLAKSK
jgi:hypothetical protein